MGMDRGRCGWGLDLVTFGKIRRGEQAVGLHFCGYTGAGWVGEDGVVGAEEVEDDEEIYFCRCWGEYRVVVMGMGTRGRGFRSISMI